VSIRNQKELAGMRRVGQVVGLALREMTASVRVGVTTAELDRIGGAVLERHGARSAPRLMYGFPGEICISVNDEAVHGIPSQRALREGDLVKLDVTAELAGYIADAAITVPVAPVSPLKRKLCASAESAFRKSLEVVRAGRPVTDIGRVVEAEVRRHGFSVIRELHGHGVGHAIHEAPSVPNYRDRSEKSRLTEGLVITIEPIIASGSGRIEMGADGWTVRTADGSMSAHYEHTIMVTRDRPVVLTTI
jgi:methionyl aminopeptidase